MLVFPSWFFGDACFSALQHCEVFLSSNTDGKGWSLLRKGLVLFDLIGEFFFLSIRLNYYLMILVHMSCVFVVYNNIHIMNKSR